MERETRMNFNDTEDEEKIEKFCQKKSFLDCYYILDRNK